MSRTLREWLDENLHRQFPLRDDASGYDTTGDFKLPTTFMTDILVCAPASCDVSGFFISRIVARSKRVDVTLAYQTDETAEAVTVGFFTVSPEAPAQSSYPLVSAAQSDSSLKLFETVTGTLTIGQCSDILELSGGWSFEKDNSGVIETRVAPVAGVRGITAGDISLTGLVELRAGSNVRFQVSQSDGGTVLTVHADISDIDEVTPPITDQASLFTNIVRKYGRPLTSINGISPDRHGNFTLQGLDCVQVNAAAGDGSVEITNSCNTPCCDKSQFSDIYDMLAELNARFGRLESFYTDLSANINALQAQAVSLAVR